MWLLVSEHVFSYVIAIFRKYDIEKNGVLGINGVPRGRVESLLAQVQNFVVCLIIGFCIKFKVSLTD